MKKRRMLAVDVGGTFTDVVAMDGDTIKVTKVPTNTTVSEEAVLTGAARLGVDEAHTFNLASTAGLNAIITRRLPKVGLLTTGGFRDVLDGGTFIRPMDYLTDPRWRREFSDGSRPLVPRYLRRGVLERITAAGDVLVPLDVEGAREQVRVLKKCGVAGVAIGLLNSYVNPHHEAMLRQIVREEMGDVPCSMSSEVSPVAREYSRFVTTVIDVVMKLLYGEYTTHVSEGLEQRGFTGQFNYADCRAMLLPADYAIEKPHVLVAGGPAAGTASSARFGEIIGSTNLICADVGGTSCDLSLVNGGRIWVNSTFDVEHDMPVNALATDIVTLGAGGGSIVAISPTGQIEVGPDSAGSHPGPACYGRGGSRPTTTDTALLIGVIKPDGFLGGQMPLSKELALQAFESLDTSLSVTQRVKYAWNIGLQNIAEGLSIISLRHGVDVRDFSLLAYGAAGPMMLPSLLDSLPLRSVIVPPYPGLFSAIGLLSSDQSFSAHRSAYQMLTVEAAGAIEKLFTEIEAGLFARLGIERDGATVKRSFDARLTGQGEDTPFVDVPDRRITGEVVEQMLVNFHDAYEIRNGNRVESLPVQAVTFRVEVIVEADKVAFPVLPARTAGNPLLHGSVELEYLFGDKVVAAEYQRNDLLAGDTLAGPAVIREDLSTTYVPSERTATVGIHGEIVIA